MAVRFVAGTIYFLFSQMLTSALGSSQPPTNGYREIFPQAKSERGTKPPTPSSAEVQDNWSCTYTIPRAFMVHTCLLDVMFRHRGGQILLKRTHLILLVAQLKPVTVQSTRPVSQYASNIVYRKYPKIQGLNIIIGDQRGAMISFLHFTRNNKKNFFDCCCSVHVDKYTIKVPTKCTCFIIISQKLHFRTYVFEFLDPYMFRPVWVIFRGYYVSAWLKLLVIIIHLNT
jgi:hypothetical protein